MCRGVGALGGWWWVDEVYRDGDGYGASPPCHHHELKMTSIFTGLESFSKLNGSEMLMMRLNALVGPRESNMAALRRSRFAITKFLGGSMYAVVEPFMRGPE